MKTPWYQQSSTQVQKTLGASASGLAADEVRVRLRQYGPNALPEAKATPVWWVALQQFASPLMMLLLFAILASLAVGEGGDAIVIAIAALMNAVVGFVQEWKAERSAEALRSYEIPHARVRREGTVRDVPANELVPGDWVLLQAGSRVPADIRLMDVSDAQVDEALLTGESYPVAKRTSALKKTVPLGDRVSMAYFGTMVVRGRAEGVVVATGSQTQLGTIATLVSTTEDEQTPLQRQLQRFSWTLGMLVVLVAIGTFGIGLYRGIELHEMLGVAIALAVAAIPEGLLIALTVVLAIGMQRMLARRALVRRLVAAETLGSVSVVCTDKTGTLTAGKMAVAQVRTLDQIVTSFSNVSDAVRDVLWIGALNNDADVSEDTGSQMGHPTECALVSAAQESGMDVAKARAVCPRVGEVPFTEERKYMVTYHKTENGEVLLVKGAPERVFAMCRMTQEAQKAWKAQERQMTEQGLRVLAVASKPYTGKVPELPTELTCKGLVGLADPLRDSTRPTIEQLQGAGIQVVLITGDHPATARTVAAEAGLLVDGQEVLVGHELDDLSDAELADRVARVAVYARVDPSHKVRIVQAWRTRNQVVAMIGDGVNDAAAMKAADIGVALGSGTDVAHETSDMVLLNNDMSSVAAAVREGRVIFDNIRTVVLYLISDSFSEVILVVGALLLGVPLPILAVQILWINLVTDGLPNLALTMEPGDPDVMDQPPRFKDEPVMNGEMKVLIFLIGIVTDIGLFGLYFYLLGGSLDLEHIRTIIFTALAIDSLLYVFAVRSLRRTIFKMNLFSNKWLLGAVIFGVLTQLAVVYVPWLQGLFGTVGLRPTDWLIVLVMAVVKLVAIEGGKELFLLRQQRQRHASQT